MSGEDSTAAIENLKLLSAQAHHIDSIELLKELNDYGDSEFYCFKTKNKRNITSAKNLVLSRTIVDDLIEAA